MKIFFALMIAIITASCASSPALRQKSSVEAETSKREYIKQVLPNIHGATIATFPIDVLFPERGEYETIEEYQKRTTTDATKIHYYDVPAKVDTYGIDQHELTIEIHESIDARPQDGHWPISCIYDSACDMRITLRKEITEDARTGTTAYGISSPYLIEKGTEWGISDTIMRYNESNKDHEEGDMKFVVSMGMENVGAKINIGIASKYIITNIYPAMAKEIKNNGVILRVGFTIPGGLADRIEDEIYVTPTINNLLERQVKRIYIKVNINTLSIINKATGDVIVAATVHQ